MGIKSIKGILHHPHNILKNNNILVQKVLREIGTLDLKFSPKENNFSRTPTAKFIWAIFFSFLSFSHFERTRHITMQKVKLYKALGFGVQSNAGYRKGWPGVGGGVWREKEDAECLWNDEAVSRQIGRLTNVA